MDFDALFTEQLDQLKTDGNYRYFAELERASGRFPRAAHHHPEGKRDVTVWCSNDYLGMGQNQRVIDAMCEAVRDINDVLNTPIIMLSAKTEPKDIAAGYAAGADSYVTKPFEPQELASLIEERMA
mgnify:CR=1 FL=1